MSWVLFALLTINLWTIANIIDKHVVSKRVKTPIIPVIIGGFGSLIYATVPFLFFGATFSPEGVLLGILFVVLLLLYYKSMKLEEASRVIAFYSLIPVFVSFLAYFLLGEVFGAEKYIGIFFAILGTALISVKKRGVVSRALKFMLIFAILYAVYSVGLKYSVDTRGFASVFASMQAGEFLAAVPLLLMEKRKVKGVKQNAIILILISQAFGVAGLLSIVYAVSLGPITLISAIENIQPIFVLLYASMLSVLRPGLVEEDVSKVPLLLKIIAIFMMVAGAYLISK